MQSAKAIVHYFEARYLRDRKDALYREYVTDALQILTEHSAQRGGKYMALRFGDIITPHKEETRTADDIIRHMKNVLGGGEPQ